AHSWPRYAADREWQLDWWIRSAPGAWKRLPAWQAARTEFSCEEVYNDRWREAGCNRHSCLTFCWTGRLLSKFIIRARPAHPKDVGRLDFRIELDIIAASIPGVARVTQEIMDLV